MNADASLLSPSQSVDGQPVPGLDEIATQHMLLAPWVTRTPTLDKTDFTTLEDRTLNFKFELLQASGTFKARAAFSNLLTLDAAQRSAGVTCLSTGNHAVAVAYAAMRTGISARIVMLHGAGRARIDACLRYGAEVVFADDMGQAFETVRRIEADECRTYVHPSNGYASTLGIATLGYEWVTQTPNLDAVIVPVGGGGLAAGVSTAIRLASPRCHVYGVAAQGADAMQRSFLANHAVEGVPAYSVADSLVAPAISAYTYALCRRHLDDLVTVDDDDLCIAMLHLFTQLKVAVEPACAASVAALLGPLRETLAGKRVGILLCGTNTDPDTFIRHLDAARHALRRRGAPLYVGAPLQ
jgi:threonine dehydratase